MIKFGLNTANNEMKHGYFCRKLMINLYGFRGSLKMYALVDCNNFYASCERIFRPELNDKPVVVLSNNDGCVIARSNEAKALGIPMGAPAFKYQKLFDEHGVAVFSSNYALYGDMSSRVMNILAEMAPEIEIYSIDEAFLLYKNCEYLDFQTLAKEMRKRVVGSTGVSVSVGFAPTKALAKVANKIAKKFTKRTGGFYVIDSDEKRDKALKWMPIEDVWGIGGRYAKKLRYHGVNTAYDFTQKSDNWVKKNFSVVGLRLKRDLEGVSNIGFEKVQNKKNIATTRSFEKMYTEYGDVKERIVTFAVSCAEKLRAQKTCCNALMVFVHTNGHRKELAQYSQNIVVKIPFPTNSSIELSKYALKGFDYIFKKGYHYKKAGVIVLDITPDNARQITLFEDSDPRHIQLMKVMDKMNQLIGHHKIKLASQDLGRTWKMRQERLSPRYTTRLDEVIIINN